MYDKPQFVGPAVAKLNAFFSQHLALADPSPPRCGLQAGNGHHHAHSRIRAHKLRSDTLKHFARNLVLAASILLAGGTSTIAHAQGQTPAASDAGGNQQQSRAQQLMGGIAPKLADLTDNVLYRDIWERPQLSKRDRSLITVAALVALNRPDQLRSHLALARQNGVTEEELIETITHMAFYAGWPNSVTAVSVAKEVLQKN